MKSRETATARTFELSRYVARPRVSQPSKRARRRAHRRRAVTAAVSSESSRSWIFERDIVVATVAGALSTASPSSVKNTTDLCGRSGMRSKPEIADSRRNAKATLWVWTLRSETDGSARKYAAPHFPPPFFFFFLPSPLFLFRSVFSFFFSFFLLSLLFSLFSLFLLLFLFFFFSFLIFKKTRFSFSFSFHVSLFLCFFVSPCFFLLPCLFSFFRDTHEQLPARRPRAARCERPRGGLQRSIQF